MTTALQLAPDCIYTIKKRSELEQIVLSGEPHIEKKWWPKGQRLFEAAREDGKRTPILFADASDCAQLLGWGLLDRVERHGKGTAATFSSWKPLDGEKTQELLFRKTGKPIADGYIRPYALCETPWFLRYERRSELLGQAARAWIVKGNPARNDLDEMLDPHLRDGWITRKPPREWAVDDFVFFWKSSPAKQVVGLGCIVDRPAGVDSEGNTRFILEYLTGPLAHPLDLDELREEARLKGASFLKSGPAGTVFPLQREQAQRLAALVYWSNPSCKPVFEDHLLGHGVLEQVTAVELEETELEPEDLAFEQQEGRRVLVTHYARERSGCLPELARRLHQERTDGMRCTVCDFDFAERYGDIGKDFAEVHHAVPLSSYDVEGAPTRVEDLVVVCANCHRMLHRRRPWLSATDLDKLLRSTGPQE